MDIHCAVGMHLNKGKASMNIIHHMMRRMHVVAMLWIIGRGSAHGYAMMKDLKDMGMENIKASRIYPILASMAKEGLVSKERRGRKVCYALTAKGKERLAAAKGFLSHGLRGEFMREMAGCKQ